MYFAPVVTTTYRMKNNKGPARGLSLEIIVPARMRAQLSNMLYINAHLSVPHEKKYEEDCYVYIEIGTTYESS